MKIFQLNMFMHDWGVLHKLRQSQERAFINEGTCVTESKPSKLLSVTSHALQAAYC